jgi:hypothetical protein
MCQDEFKLDFILDWNPVLISLGDTRFELAGFIHCSFVDGGLPPSKRSIKFPGSLIVVRRDEPQSPAVCAACMVLGPFEQRRPHSPAVNRADQDDDLALIIADIILNQTHAPGSHSGNISRQYSPIMQNAARDDLWRSELIAQGCFNPGLVRKLNAAYLHHVIE